MFYSQQSDGILRKTCSLVEVRFWCDCLSSCTFRIAALACFAHAYSLRSLAGLPRCQWLYWAWSFGTLSEANRAAPLSTSWSNRLRHACGWAGGRGDRE